MWMSWGFSCVEHTVFPGPECLCFFPEVIELFSHYFFNMSFPSLCLSSPPRTLVMRLVYLMSQSSLKLPLLLRNPFFLFAVLSGWYPLPCLPSGWSMILHYLVCYKCLLVYFSVQLLYSLTVSSVWNFLIFSVSLLNFSLYPSIILLDSTSIMTNILKSLSGKLFISISLFLFPCGLISSFGDIFFCFPNLFDSLWFMCVYLLWKTVLQSSFPVLEG